MRPGLGRLKKINSIGACFNMYNSWRVCRDWADILLEGLKEFQKGC